jgi:hypothetical protein
MKAFVLRGYMQLTIINSCSRLTGLIMKVEKTVTSVDQSLMLIKTH